MDKQEKERLLEKGQLLIRQEKQIQMLQQRLDVCIKEKKHIYEEYRLVREQNEKLRKQPGVKKNKIDWPKAWAQQATERNLALNKVDQLTNLCESLKKSLYLEKKNMGKKNLSELEGKHHPFCKVTYKNYKEFSLRSWTCCCRIVEEYDDWRKNERESSH